jgi:uncharacterized protein YjbI with pentapeptide repeats
MHTVNLRGVIGRAVFESTTVESDAVFRSALICKEAEFRGATFQRFADFSEARFLCAASFTSVMFEGYADFEGAHFADAAFYETQFEADVTFRRATFEGMADFYGMSARRRINMQHATFLGNVRFNLDGNVDLTGAVVQNVGPSSDIGLPHGWALARVRMNEWLIEET